MTIKERFDPKISVGNLIQIGVLLVALTFGWAEMESRSDQSEKEIARLQASIDQFAGTLELRVRTLESSAVRSDERVANMISLLSRIDSRLERIESSYRIPAP
jgi:hypothetical protein